MSWSLLLVYRLKFFSRVAIPFYSASTWFNDELEYLVAANKSLEAVKAYRHQFISSFSPWNPWATFPTAQALAGTRA
jgi:hypothetical protein